MKISYQSIANILTKITGVSTPMAGISWNPPPSELEMARNLIIFLENKRVLYEDYGREFPPFVSRSIIDIRNRLTEDLEKLGTGTKLGQHFREMRSACIEFQQATDSLEGPESYQIDWDEKQKRYFRALGRLRERFGHHLSLVAVEYGVDVEEDLASIFPSYSKAK